MAQLDDDEIDVLRRRAYGPHADIHLDADALRRLRELESRRAATEGAPGEAEAPEQAGEGLPDDAASRDPAEHEGDTDPPVARRVRLRLRRSTVVLMVISGTVLAIIAAALVLVQRVQSDPLQVGAAQIGRLSVDSSYRVPDVFGGGSGPSAYQEFHGLRAVIYGSKNPCLTVFRAADITDPTSDSFSGTAFSGCTAGRFPAMVQFSLDDSLPTDIRAPFPKTTALQFVYDEAHDEVVVFATR